MDASSTIDCAMVGCNGLIVTTYWLYTRHNACTPRQGIDVIKYVSLEVGERDTVY